MKKMTLLILFTCSFIQAQISFKHIATYTNDEFREIRMGEFPLNCIIDNPFINTPLASGIPEITKFNFLAASRGRRISQILSTNETTIEFVSQSAGPKFISPVGDSSNTVSITEPTNFIRQMRIVGDTGVNYISTDDDCGNNKRIESISFFPIRIQFAN